MTELIITEKPSAASKIAAALADSKPVKKSEKKVPYYLLSHNKKDIIIASAVGHLYTIDEKTKSNWKYPVYEIEWVEAGSKKGSAFTKKYLQVIKKLAKEANEYTVATDYDVEGEVIGMNIIRFACNQKDANRMKFSTLTKPDLIKSYEEKNNTLDWGQAYAGETRHFLDWLYGINLSRALTAGIKNATNSFKIMSIGRVQGPALKIIVDREKEIQAFKPEPYWEIQLKGKVKKGGVEAWHKLDKIFDKKIVDEILEKVKNAKQGTIKDISRKEFQQPPPTPFDLTTLQTECYRVHKIQPKQTLALAQDLYIAGAISYPRTSSQKLPPSIGYRNILSQIARQELYKELAEQLLSLTTLKPKEGKKTDDAHPAIFPTGIPPDSKLSSRHLKVYDLIVKRFMATFGKPAVRSTITITIDVNQEEFIAKGTRTIEEGWHTFYKPYVKLEEVELPEVEKGEEVIIKSIKEIEKETQPPKRYTPASIIKELEKRGLGTKATRSEIIDTLFRRNYVDGKSIKATKLGMDLVEILLKYCPSILDEKLTRKFEEDMELIRKRAKTEEEVLDEAKKVLSSILEEFKSKEKEIGKALAEANASTRTELSTLGKCPECGGNLIIQKGKFGRFIACDNYPKCKITFKLPAKGNIRPTNKTCEACGYPIIAISKGKSYQEVCINPDCPLKKENEVKSHEKEGSPCPKCKKGKLVLRSSLFGKFLGCSRYPRCKYTERI